MIRPLEERFWEKVDRRGSDDCWLWKAGGRGNGYGAFKVRNKVVDAHVVAYELTHGAKPLPGICVTHSCDQRKCCNPAHLVAGTKLDNHRDMVKRGRAPTEATSASLRRKRDAEGVPGQKLSREKVERIRAVWAEGSHTHASLGIMFGVGRSSIGRIVRGERWVDELRSQLPKHRREAAA